MENFGELSDSIFEMLVQLAKQCSASRLEFVADCYPNLSIKKAERSRRPEKGVQRMQNELVNGTVYTIVS